MAMSERLERTAVVVTATCTLLLTALGISRHLGYGAPPRRTAIVEKPTKVADWARVVDGGHWLGDRNAKVTVVEFGDFECPFCQYFATTVKPALVAEFGSDVAFVYRHFPLSYHKLAKPYAVASECAGMQRRFWQFHDLVFAKADSMGLKTIESFAQEAGVPDLREFAACVRDPKPLSSINRDVEEAGRAGVTGTPTVVINGMKLSGSDEKAVAAEVRNALARR